MLFALKTRGLFSPLFIIRALIPFSNSPGARAGTAPEGRRGSGGLRGIWGWRVTSSLSGFRGVVELHEPDSRLWLGWTWTEPAVRVLI